MTEVLRWAAEGALGAFVAVAIMWGAIGLIVLGEIACELICDQLNPPDAEAVELARIEAAHAQAVAEIRETTRQTLGQLDELYRSRVIEGTAREVERW